MELVQQLEDGPELEMYDPINPHLGDVAEVEDPVGGAGDAEEEDTCDGEECGPKVGFLSRLRDRCLEGNEGCILVSLSMRLIWRDSQAYHSPPYD